MKLGGSYRFITCGSAEILLRNQSSRAILLNRRVRQNNRVQRVIRILTANLLIAVVIHMITVIDIFVLTTFVATTAIVVFDTAIIVASITSKPTASAAVTITIVTRGAEGA